MADQGEHRNDRQVRRRRQQLTRIEDKQARQVSFSKRRKGLFKKAFELATLCGAEVGILLHSPGGRPYTFGSPAVHLVLNRFHSDNFNQPIQGLPNPPASEYLYQHGAISNLNQQLVNLSNQLDAVSLRRALLNDHLTCAANVAPECNWSQEIEELHIDELTKLLECLLQTKERLVARKRPINQERYASSSRTNVSIANYPDQTHPLIIGNSSLAQGFLVTGSQPIQANQNIVRPPEPRMAGILPPSINTNPAGGVDTVSLNQDLVPSSGGANNSSMQPLKGFSFGPFGYNSELFFRHSQSQGHGMMNPQMLFNFNPFSYGPAPIESGTIASVPGSYIYNQQGPFNWGNENLGRNFLDGLGSGAQEQAGPSNPRLNDPIIGPSETNNDEVDPDTSSYWQGP